MLYGAEPYIYTEAPKYDSRATLRGGERFPAGAALQLVTNRQRRALAPGLAASADADVSFDGKRVLFAGRRRAGAPWAIFEVPLEGGTPRQVTSFAEDTIAPFYLPDDKIVYARRAPQGFRLEILPLAGGTPLRLTYGPGSQVATDVLHDGRVLFDGQHGASAGREIWAVYTDGSGVETHRCDHGADRFAGRELGSGDIIFQEGARLARFTSARATALELALPKGEYLAPVAEVSPDEWLVSYRSAAAGPFGLYRLRTKEQKLEPTGFRQAVQPVVVRARPVPPRHPSSLGDRDGSNLLCLNAYTSRGNKVPDGSVAMVRVYARDEAGTETLLGESKVERDGSFYVQTPSERPIRFELLDRHLKIVLAEKGYFWTRRGEQRVCVGCHAGPERAPENAVPQVLLRTQEPVKMRGSK